MTGAAVAASWGKGLADWGIEGSAVASMVSAVETWTSRTPMRLHACASATVESTFAVRYPGSSSRPMPTRATSPMSIPL